MKLEKATNILETLYGIEEALTGAIHSKSDTMKESFICMALEKIKRVRKELAEFDIQII